MTELLLGRELFDNIKDRGSLEEWEAAEIAEKIVSALRHMHASGIAHRDLKPENIR